MRLDCLKFCSLLFPLDFLEYRRNRINKKLISEKFTCKMGNTKEKGTPIDTISGNMIFEPILEDGVFRFDCTSDDRAAAFPSFSFMKSKDRDTPISSQKLPTYVPVFERLLGQQIVKLKVSFCIDIVVCLLVSCNYCFYCERLLHRYCSCYIYIIF